MASRFFRHNNLHPEGISHFSREQSNDNNRPSARGWQVHGAKRVHEIEYCNRSLRNDGDAESSGAGNETVKGQ